VIGLIGRESHSPLQQLKILQSPTKVRHIGWQLAGAREYLLTSVASTVSSTVYLYTSVECIIGRVVECSPDITHVDGFYPRDTMLALVIEIAACLSVRLSVRPSHAGIVSKRRKLAA